MSPFEPLQLPNGQQVLTVCNPYNQNKIECVRTKL